MAGSVNKVILIGHLGAKPELKYLPSGQAVCEMRIATNEAWSDKQNQRQERTEWHRVIAWGKTGENCAQFLNKGRQIYIEGRLQTRSWDDKNTGEKRYMTEIVANQVTFLGSGGADAGATMGQGGGASRGEGAPMEGFPPPSSMGATSMGNASMGGEDDIPF